MKDKIKEILINRLGQVVKDDVLEDLSTEINQMVRHNLTCLSSAKCRSQFMQSGKKDNITIDDVINKKASVGDIFKYRDNYYEIVDDDTRCGFDGVPCGPGTCPFDDYGCMYLSGFKKI